MKRIFILSAIIMSIFLVSCQKNESEIKKPEKEPVMTKDTTALTISSEISDREGVYHIIISFSEAIDKESLKDYMGIFSADIAIDSLYEITNQGTVVDIEYPNLDTDAVLTIKEGFSGDSGAVLAEDFVLPLPRIDFSVDVTNILIDEPISVPLDFEMELAQGYEAEYFIAPGIVTTTVNLYILSNGDFIVNEIGKHCLTRLKAYGSGAETFLQWHGPIFAFDVDANDNAYFYEGSLNNAEDTGSIVKVYPDGEWKYLVKNSELLNSDWDTGWIAVARDGTVYMLAYVDQEKQETLIRINTDGNCTVLVEEMAEQATDIAISDDGKLYVSGPEKVWELDAETGDVLEVVFERSLNQQLDLSPMWSECLSIAPDGSIYAGDGSVIVKINTDGTIQKIAEGFVMAQGTVSDEDGNLYVVTRSAGGILKIGDEVCEYIYQPAHLNTPNKIAINDGVVYIMQCETLDIKAYTDDREYVRTYFDVPQFPPYYGLAVDGDGNLFVLYSTLPYFPNLPMVLAVYEKNSAKRTILIEDFGRAHTLKYKNGTLYAYEQGEQIIYQVDKTGTKTVVLTNIELAQDFDVDSQSVIYYTKKEVGALIANDGSNIWQYDLPKGFSHIYSVYITEDDEIYVLAEYDAMSAVLLLDEGEFSIIAQGIPSGSDIAVDDSGIYITNYSESCVYRLNKSS